MSAGDSQSSRVEMLKTYEHIIDDLSADNLAQTQPHIPRDIDQILCDSTTCLDREVCEALADCLLSFMCPKSPGKDPGRPALWAADQLAKRAKSVMSDTAGRLNCTKSQCWMAVEEHPKIFFSLLSDDDLLEFSKSSLNSDVETALISEMEKRHLPYSASVFETLDLSRVESSIVFKAFVIFLENPTMDGALKFWTVFENQPPLHLLCANSCLDKNRGVLRMLGRVIEQRFPLKYPLWMFYHKSVRPVAEEVESVSANATAIDLQSFRESLTLVPFPHTPFLVLLILEFPDFLDLIKECDPDRHDAIQHLLNQ